MPGLEEIGQGVDEEWRTVAVAQDHRDGDPALAQREVKTLDEGPVLIVDRRAPSKSVIVRGHLDESGLRHIPSRRDPSQKRQDLIDVLRATKREHDDRVIRGQG